jgi:outer membrane lipoprotein-sorting protein
MNKENDKLNQAIDALRNMPVPQGPSDTLIRQTLNRIAQTQPQTITPDTGIRRLFMKRFMKFAAAAVIILGVLGGLHFLSPSGSHGVVWAEVVQRVRQAKAFSYKMHITMTGEPATTNIDGTVWMTSDNRMVMEMDFNSQPGSITYLLPEQKKMVTVMPTMKKYMEVELTDDLTSKTKQQNQDPREWVQRMVYSQYKSIGKTTIDGIEVEGLETTDPAIAGGITENILARLWVDVKTGYPVQMEQDMDMNEGKTHMHSIIHDFQWMQDVDAAIFTPQIDADYTPLPKIQMPKMDEPSAIEGLRKYAQLYGKYPDSLNMVNLMSGQAKDMQNNTNKMMDPNQFKGMSKEEALSKMTGIDPNELKGLSKDEIKKKIQGLSSQDQIISKTVETTLQFQPLAMFYMTLVQGKKDPAYYGKTVTPGDTQVVLLRWKSSDTTYKVIMGDLSASEMSAEQLKQIEPPLDQPPTNP